MTRPAVFLDRDGTIIEDRGYISRLDAIRLFPFAAEALRRLRDAGFVIVVVTNQAGVARGYFEESFIARAHRHLDALLAAEGAAVDAYYYCPHHRDGVVPEYTRECECRKPAPGMILAAARDLDLDVARSFMVGDKWLDIGLAQNAGVRGVLVRTGYGEQVASEPPPGLAGVPITATLLDAAEWILSTLTRSD